MMTFKICPTLFFGDVCAFPRQQAAALLARSHVPSPSSPWLSFLRTYSYCASPTLSSRLSFASYPSSNVSCFSAFSASSSSLVSWRPRQRDFLGLTAAAPWAAYLRYTRRLLLFPFAEEVTSSVNLNRRVLPAAKEAAESCQLLRGLTRHVAPARSRVSPPVFPITTRFFSSPGGRGSSSSIAEQHQQRVNSSASRAAASSASTADDLSANNSDRSASSSSASLPTRPLPSPPVSSGATAAAAGVSSSSCPVPSAASPPSTVDVTEPAVPFSAAASASSVPAAAPPVSSAGAAPGSRAPASAGAAAHAPRLHRLVLPPTLPQSLKESGEGKAAIAAAMERALEGRAADQRKLVLGRKLSGNDHMRMVVPKERKKRTKHTGGQNATY